MKVIYTCLFGNYEELKQPRVITEGWKYICLTDQPLKSNVWEIHQYANVDDPVRLARRLKIMGGVGQSIYIDASFTINCDLNEWWDKYFIHPFTVIEHPIRNCIYSEATACIGNQRGNDADIRNQADYYLKLGVPICGGLIQSGILMRDNTKEVEEFCKVWFDQIRLSTRDQIGFGYAEWFLKVKWPRIKWDYRKGQEFLFKTHYKRRYNANSYRGN